MSTPKLAVPPPLRGADAGSFAEHSIVHRLPHIAQRVVAENPLTAAIRHRIDDLIAAIPHRTLEAFTDPEAPDMPDWYDYVRPYLDHNWLQVPWFLPRHISIVVSSRSRTSFAPRSTPLPPRSSRACNPPWCMVV